MSNVTVILSEQDLYDFLEGNQEWMFAYINELEKRLTEYFGNANVETSAFSDDKIDIDGEPDDGEVAHIMNLMVNDWSCLPQ